MLSTDEIDDEDRHQDGMDQGDAEHQLAPDRPRPEPAGAVEGVHGYAHGAYSKGRTLRLKRSINVRTGA